MDSTKTLKVWQEEALVNQQEYLKNAMKKALQEIVDQEFNQFIGAQCHERTESRRGYRNGSYVRHLITRVGSIELHICRDRLGAFRTELFDRYQRSEKAFVLALVQMYLKGVSTRKVSKIVQELCGLTLSKSLISKLTITLDEELNQWRTRPLERSYPYLVFDARYEKVRENNRVVCKAVVIALGIDDQGKREVLGCWVMNSESYQSWHDCIGSLKSRGLQGVHFVVSDENKGLRKALQKHFQGIKLQRCQVHFMRNFLNKLTARDQKDGMLLLKEVFAAHSREITQTCVTNLVEFLISRKKEYIAHWIEENIEECLHVLDLPYEHRTKMKSTNMLERLNQEIKRRSRVVRIFPTDESCLRLVTALCQEISEFWSTRKYLPEVR